MAVVSGSNHMMRLALVPVLLAIAQLTAIAAGRVAQLGDARVQYVDTRWQATERPGRIEFIPTGKDARRLDRAHLRLLEDDATCAELALQAFAIGHYDTEGMTPTPVTVGGIAGERFEAHTGCRNATPRGVVICVKSAGNAYVLQSLNPGCTGNNLFSGIDPLAEIAAGISFSSGTR
jgi:hypothetical protein